MSGTANGSSGSGLDESDWIDRVLERAAARLDSGDTFEVAPVQHDGPAARLQPSSKVDLAATPPAPANKNDLGSIMGWSETPASEGVLATASSETPASEGMLATASSETMARAGVLTAADAGRSAWTADLAAGDNEPDEWGRLSESWSNLDAREDELASLDDSARADAPRSTFGRMLREWGPVLVLALAIAFFSRMFLVQAYHIPSGSMEPTLENGDRVIVNRLSYSLGDIERGQVVVFASPPGNSADSDHLIKRVIGLPGESIQLKDGQVWVDGFRLEEPYLKDQAASYPISAGIPGCAQDDVRGDICVVPEDTVLVMGDNRGNSRDGRLFGPIETDTIVGRAFVQVWPATGFDWL